MPRWRSLRRSRAGRPAAAPRAGTSGASSATNAASRPIGLSSRSTRNTQASSCGCSRGEIAEHEPLAQHRGAAVDGELGRERRDVDRASRPSPRRRRRRGGRPAPGPIACQESPDHEQRPARDVCLPGDVVGQVPQQRCPATTANGTKPGGSRKSIGHEDQLGGRGVPEADRELHPRGDRVGQRPAGARRRGGAPRRWRSAAIGTVDDQERERAISPSTRHSRGLSGATRAISSKLLDQRDRGRDSRHSTSSVVSADSAPDPQS